MVFVDIDDLESDRMEVLEARYKLGSKMLRSVIFMISFSEIIPVSCKE